MADDATVVDGAVGSQVEGLPGRMTDLVGWAP